MALALLQSDDLTPVTDLTVTNLQAGAASDVLEVHLWNDQGNPGGQDLYDVRMAVYAEDPGNPGTWLKTGVTPQDELWVRIRLSGQDNTARPEQQDLTTDWTPIGAYADFLLPSVLAGAARYLQLQWKPPSGAAVAAWRWRLVPIVGEHAYPVPAALTAVHRGILHGVGDPARHGLVRGGLVSPATPADDTVTVAAATWLHRGRLHGKVATSHTLDQTDGQAAALAAGESYKVVITLGAGVTVTKSDKAVAPVRPTPPAGEVVLDTVTVTYEAGGTSIIESGDLAGGTLYDRHHAEIGSGLQVRLHPGLALGGSTQRYHSQAQDQVLSPNVTTYVWQLASGLYETTEDDDTAPETTALGPWWEADTDGVGVTALRDRRTYAGETVVLRLAGATPGAPGQVADLLVEHEALYVERFVGRVSDNGGGSSGDTVLDWEVDGATAYTSQGTDDQRPRFAFDATVLVDEDSFPELLLLRRGQVLSLHVDALPTGGSPATVEGYWVCRRL